MIAPPPPPSNNNNNNFRWCRMKITMSRSRAASECRHGRYNHNYSWPWWGVAPILFLTRLSPSDAAFQPPSWLSSVSCDTSHFHREKDVMKSPSQSSSSSSPAQLFSTSASYCASLSSQSLLLDPNTSRQRRRLSSVALFATQTSNADSSLEIIPQASVNSDKLCNKGNANELLASQQQQQQLLLLLRQLQKYKTNKSICRLKQCGLPGSVFSRPSTFCCCVQVLPTRR
jgi:hypothetical protein